MHHTDLIILRPIFIIPSPRRLGKPTRRLIRSRRPIIASSTTEPTRRRLVAVVAGCGRTVEARGRSFEAAGVGGSLVAGVRERSAGGWVGVPGGLLKAHVS